MRVKRYNSNKLCLINCKKYLIDWNWAPSKEQLKFQQLLYPYLRNHIMLAEMRIPGTLYRFDLVDCTTKIIYEYSPISHHDSYNPFFHHNKSGFLSRIKSDMNKRKWAEENGFKVLDIQKSNLDDFSPQYIWDKFGIDIL